APQRKKRRARKAKQLPAIFEDPMLPGLELDAEPAPPPPPTSHPAPPEAAEPAHESADHPAPRIVVTDAD
ncbi:MAG: hypothetical protein ACREH4_16210, partial [Vitreimonas sp.]